MNKKDFKHYMQQGIGRCVLHLQSSQDIEKYKDIVLWGCLHNLSYDTQCEGTRASYLYELTTFFHDEAYFLIPVITAFEKLPRNADWLFSHYCELLRRFAENGNETAQNALQKKYNQLLSTLLNKRRWNGYDHERDNFERICQTLSSLGGIDTLLKIADDMGYLFRNNPHYQENHFDWFCSSMDHGIGKKRLNAILSKESKKSENIDCFYQNYLNALESFQNIVRKSTEALDVDTIKEEAQSTGSLSSSSRVRFSRHSDQEERIKLIKEALAETDLNIKAELLSVFAFRDENFPLAHETIIAYSKSSHERLREVAFDILTNCQSQIVTEYALSLLSHQEYKSYAIKMLLCNYTPKIKHLLLTELSEIKIDYEDTSDWHSIGGKILNVCDQNIRLPKEFFIYIYNTTLCSCCREYAIRALMKKRWLTREIIEECRYDSNDKISEYVNRYYPVKK